MFRRRRTSALQLIKRSTCASLFICQKRSSSAASSPALQLEQTKASTKRREQESMSMQEHRRKAAVVAGCSSLWNSPLPPTVLPKGNGHFCSSFRKKIACGAQPKPLFAGERRCAARIGYPPFRYHPRHPWQGCRHPGKCVPRRVLQRRLRTWQVDVFAGRHRLRWRCLERGVMTQVVTAGSAAAAAKPLHGYRHPNQRTSK